MIAYLLALALALPLPWYAPGAEPETSAERTARIDLIVRAAVDATEQPPEGWPGTPEDLAAAVLAKTWHESRRWALEVHDGTVRGDLHPVTGIGRSCGLGQTWGRCDHVGTSFEQTRAHLADVAAILAYHAQRCRVRRLNERSVALLFGAYGTGRTCRPLVSSWPRARLWERLRWSQPPRVGPGAYALQ